MTANERLTRYQALHLDINKFFKQIGIENKVSIDRFKLRQVIEKYSNDTEQIKRCFNSEKTNESKQCVLTIKALNLYKPICLVDYKDIKIDGRLNYINEIVALYCGFMYFKKEVFKRKFMNEPDFIYILNSNSIDYEQLMITLNIFYKDYS